jgi:putative nucleotidyltransferase with HDIG domain
MGSEIKHISIDDLQVGMFITDGNNQWVPDGNASRKGLVSRDEVIKQIRAIGVKDLYIDITKGKDIDPPTRITKKGYSYNSLPEPTVSFAQEIKNAKQIKTEASVIIRRCMHDVKMGNTPDVADMSHIANKMIQSLTQNHNALNCVTQLRNKDQYLMEHSFNVSVLMGLLASAMGYSGDGLHELVTGALLHDIGKIRIPDEILHKPGKLLPDEWDEMRKHVTYGEEILRKTPSITPIMLDICAQHHEKIDGSGYPRGLKGDEIPIHTRMAAIADVYDAITANRVYHKGMAPTTALKRLREWSAEGHLDGELACYFIQAVGMYPVGSVVELDNQKLAIVTEANSANPAKPKVIKMYDLKLRRYSNKLAIDLSDERCGRSIVKAVYADNYGIKLDGFF